MLVSFLLVSLLFAGKIVCYESFDEFEDDESFAEASAKTLWLLSVLSGKIQLETTVQQFYVRSLLIWHNLLLTQTTECIDV